MLQVDHISRFVKPARRHILDLRHYLLFTENDWFSNGKLERTTKSTKVAWSFLWNDIKTFLPKGMFFLYALISHLLGEVPVFAFALTSIAVNHTSSGTSTLATLSISHTCSGTNRILYAMSGSLGSPSSIVFNTSESLTQVDARNDVYIFSLIAPSATTANVLYTITGTTTEQSGSNISFTGADQTQSGIAVANSGNSGTLSITTNFANSFIVQSMSNALGTGSASSSQTEIQNSVAGVNGYAQAYKATTTAGSYAMNYSAASLGNDLVEVKDGNFATVNSQFLEFF